MTIIDYENLSTSELIAAYVLECRGKGNTLPYSDMSTIDAWLELAPDVDALLLILSDVLPKFYAKKRQAALLPPLNRIDQKVKKRLLALAARARTRV